MAAGVQALDANGPATGTDFLTRLRSGSARRVLLSRPQGAVRRGSRPSLCRPMGGICRGRRLIRPGRIRAASCSAAATAAAAAALAESCLLQRRWAADSDTLGVRQLATVIRPARPPQKPVSAAAAGRELDPFTTTSTTGLAAAALTTTTTTTIVLLPPALGRQTWAQAARQPTRIMPRSDAGPSGPVVAEAQGGRREARGTRASRGLWRFRRPGSGRQGRRFKGLGGRRCQCGSFGAGRAGLRLRVARRRIGGVRLGSCRPVIVLGWDDDGPGWSLDGLVAVRDRLARGAHACGQGDHRGGRGGGGRGTGGRGGAVGPALRHLGLVQRRPALGAAGAARLVGFNEDVNFRCFR